MVATGLPLVRRGLAAACLLGVTATVAHAAPAFDAIAPTLRLTLGWVTFAALLGIGVLVFASRALEGVLDTLEVDVSRAFWIGVATQLAAVPVLVLSCVVLAATIVGILGIPIVAAAWILALIGLTALGVVATARLIGHGLLGQRTVVRGAGTTRPDALRALLIGLTVLVAFWIGAALVDDMPVVGVLLRAVALALTWVAATAGMGAAVLSRGGRRRPAVPRVAPRVGDLPDWQTPTPVSGVVAARRPPVPDPVD